MCYELAGRRLGNPTYMDAFALITFGSLLVAFLTFLAIGHVWRGRPLEEITDREADRKWAAQQGVEEGDIPQMLAAANEYRRKRGQPELTPEEFGAQVEDEQRKLLRQAEKQLRAAAQRGDPGRERRGF
jgi:hypothetical protein